MTTKSDAAPTGFSFACLLTLAAILAFTLPGCQPQDLDTTHSVDAGPPSSTDASDDGADGSAIALIIDGREVTVAEIHDYMKDQFLEEFLEQPEDRQFEMREGAARDLLQSHVIEAEAKKRGLTEEELFDEIASAVDDPTEEEIAVWYAKNQSRLRGAPFDDVKAQIKNHLGRERRAAALDDYLEAKLDALSWRLMLSPPRHELEATRLTRGSPEAPVTIMTFSDYQCPFCIRAEPVLTEVLSRYPDQVRVVHRHFPLDSIHPFARPAAEAAMCADEQGQFLAFHDAIFGKGGKLASGSLAQIGVDLGLDVASLNQCIEERRFKDFVEADFKAGQEAGVTGTPAFFINGISLKGARDADELSRYVDMELARIEER